LGLLEVFVIGDVEEVGGGSEVVWGGGDDASAMGGT
jgi:hypothetical protein